MSGERAGLADEGNDVVQLVEEIARVGKRQAEGSGARVHVGVSEYEQTVQALLMRQDVSVERVAVGTVVQEKPPMRQEGDTVIVPVLEEVLITEKRLILKEELRIRITEQSHVETQVIRLRRETATIERDGAAASSAERTE